MNNRSAQTLLMLMLSAMLVFGTAALAQAVDLTVKKACISMPDAAVTDLNAPGDACPAGTIKIWRFKRTDVAETAPVPPGALVIDAVEGDSLTINVANELGVPVSLFMGGQAMSNNTGPVWVSAAAPYGTPTATGSRPGGDVSSRVRSFAHEAPAGAPGAPGASTAYTWSNLRAGTYLIESGTHPSLQVPMGLYAALVVRTAGGAPYAGEPVPDNEQVLLFSEMDPAVHNAADDVTQTFPATNTYNAKYFLINGRPFPGGNPLPIGAAGSATLLRFLNAGVDTYMPLVQGPKITPIAEDGHLIAAALRLQPNVVQLHSGKTVDVAMTNPAAAGYVPLYDRRLYLSNATMTPGGMYVYLEVPDSVQYTLTAATNGGTGTGNVAAESMPGGIFCDSAKPLSDCTQTYNSGALIKLAAHAHPGSLHKGWVVSPADPADNCPDLGGADCIIAMNQAKSVTAAFAAQSRVHLITPNGGERIAAGSQYTVTWGAPANAATFRLRYSLNNGVSWILIKNGITGTSLVWNVPTPSKNRKRALMQVTAYNASGVRIGGDVSDAPFRIEVLSIISPAGGEVWSSGVGQVAHPITWVSQVTKGLVKSIVLEYRKNAGARWLSITTLDNTTGAYDAGGTYNWQISPQVGSAKPNSQVRITLKNAAGGVIGRVVSNTFTITP